ncbi:MAG TPA: hypothetical protein PLS10_06550 [Chitinophagales bacterium]|nr:hypothetical protein [Chitinophagales bacterium]
MNIQLHDILSNPVLLKDVSDETLQSWIQQYPYVSLFHLYALKNKKKYSETDLHKTAFYFNNREKLYFLLNDKQFESKTIPTYEKINTVPPPVEIKQVFEQDEKISIPHIEETAETEKEEEIVTQTDTETEIEHQDVTIEETIKDTVETEHSEQETAVIEEPIVHDEIIHTENDITTPVVELSSENQEVTEAAIKVIPVIADNQPLSIADKILLEIQQLKEERARKEKQTEVIEEKTIEVPELETTEEIIEPVEEKSEEETDAIVEHETIEENEIIAEKQEEVEDIIKEKTEVPAEEKTLSIQEEVIARIQKIKEERERGQEEQHTVSTTVTEDTKEEIPVHEITETTEETYNTAAETIIEEKQEEIPEIITETTTLADDKHEKPLSIQEEVIARIQKIKEERERRLADENNLTPAIQEEDLSADRQEKEETVVPEIIKTETEKTDDVAETSLPVIETTTEDKQQETTEIKSETTEKTLSIQDEIIARIQQIKDERAKKLAGGNNLTTVSDQEEIKTEIPAEDIITIPETISEITYLNKESETTVETPNEDKKAENISDIIIVEKTIRPFIEIVDEKNPLEEMLNVSATDVYEKDIELIESKLLPEIEQEYNDVDVLSEIHQPVHSAFSETEKIHSAISITDILPPVEETIEENTSKEEETEADRFASAFPEPLLVQVDTSKAKSEITPVTIEQLQEETIVPIKEIVENKNVEPETVVEIAEEQLHDLPMENRQEKINENASLISNKSDLFIPNVEEDLIETPVEKDNPAEDIQSENLGTALNIQHLKEEPHTFIEWLKLLDGNLQIQTTETPKETDNWIEIPRYEVEQAIAHKNEIQKEEQKLFEPNFEEGEVDLFNEIDEEVSKVASESVRFKQDMMTETLAKIYVKQGKTDKALEIYNTLLMRFPEKSAYFASLIQKIEKEK